MGVYDGNANSNWEWFLFHYKNVHRILGMQIIDSVSTYTWSDSEYLIQKGTYYGLEGSDAFSTFYAVPSIGSTPMTTLFISTIILIGITLVVFFIGQSAFKRKELK